MKKTIILLALVSLLGACKKNDDNNNNPGNGSTSDLTTGSWKMTASSSDIEYPAPIGTQTIDLYSFLQSCETDNTFKFNTDQSITVDEGASKCDAGDPQSTTGGTWTLTNNNTQFTQVAQGTTITATVLTLNSSTFKIRYVTTAGSINSTTTTTYTHL
jgi:hypothetical protein